MRRLFRDSIGNVQVTRFADSGALLSAYHTGLAAVI